LLITKKWNVVQISFLDYIFIFFGEIMKNRIVCGAAMILLGLLIVFGPQFLFKACNLTEDSIPRCHWSIQAEIGIGMILSMLGVCIIIFVDLRTRLGLTIGVFFSSIVSLLVPHVLIGGCNMMTMACRKVAFPALTIISGVILLVAIVDMIYLERTIKKEEEHDTAI
jgi:hypothetical protein